MTPNFLSLLARISRLESSIADQSNRVYPIQKAIVTNNIDPEGLRRIKCSREVQGGFSESFWVQCGRSKGHTDEPLPNPGETILVAACNGDPHDLHYLRHFCNDTNPPDTNQSDPVKDNTIVIPGQETKQVGKDQSLDVKGDQSIEVSGNTNYTVNGGEFNLKSENGNLTIEALSTVTISNEAGASITLLTDGSIVLKDSTGKILKWGSGVFQWDFNNGSLNVVNASDFKINGKQVATVGAKTNDNQTIVQKGWT